MADEVETPQAPDAAVDEGSGSETKKADGAGVPPKGETAEERKFRLKFGKDEREVSERELIALGQKGWAADERFSQASKMRKEVEDAVKNGDIDRLIELKHGKKADDWAKERLQAKLRIMTMTPEQKEAYEARQELDRVRAETDKLKKAQESEKTAKLQAHYEAQYDKELSDAIQAEGLPKNRVAVGRAVQLASKVIDMGLEPDWGLVVREAKRQIVDEMKELFGGYKDDALLELLGDDIPKRLGKAMAARATVVGRAKQPKLEGDQRKTEEPKTKAMDTSTWLKEQRKKFEDG